MEKEEQRQRRAGETDGGRRRENREREERRVRRVQSYTVIDRRRDRCRENHEGKRDIENERER